MVKEMVKMKRKDECLFCSSRKCYTRIVTDDKRYDEISCGNHVIDMEKHSNNVLGRNNGVMRWHVSSTGRVRRDDAVPHYDKPELMEVEE